MAAAAAAAAVLQLLSADTFDSLEVTVRQECVNKDVSTHLNVLFRLSSAAVRPLSPNFSTKASLRRSKNAKGICLPNASSATTRKAADK